MAETMMNKVAWWLVIIGGLNWGLAAFNWNLVTLIFGSIPMLVTLVYVLVGLSALYLLFGSFKK